MQQPRRIELPFKRNGVAHVMIARENNDGEAVSYVYALTAFENEGVNAGGVWVYPYIPLSDGESEQCFGELDVSIRSKKRKEKMDAAWEEACAAAHKEVIFLQN